MRTSHVLSGLTLLLAFVFAVAGCRNDSSYSSGAATGPAPSSTNAPPNTILIGGSAFSPGSITVSKNTVVTWTNNDGVAHTATSDAGDWDTGNIPPGGTKTITFTTAGSFSFHCAYHSFMKGTVVVQ